MTIPKTPLGASARDSQHDRRTQLVKEQLAKESAAQDAKTARLKALRLARDAAEPPPAAPLPKTRKKAVKAAAKT